MLQVCRKVADGCEHVCLQTRTGMGKTVVGAPIAAQLVLRRKVVCFEPSRNNARNPAKFVASQNSFLKVAFTTGDIIRAETEFDRDCDLLCATGGRIETLVRQGYINPSDTFAIFDEAHGLSLGATGVHLALRGVPKVLMTADPVSSFADALRAPIVGRSDDSPPLLERKAVARGLRVLGFRDSGLGIRV